jgi:hypothetical protein
VLLWHLHSRIVHVSPSLICLSRLALRTGVSSPNYYCTVYTTQGLAWLVRWSTFTTGILSYSYSSVASLVPVPIPDPDSLPLPLKALVSVSLAASELVPFKFATARTDAIPGPVLEYWTRSPRSRPFVRPSGVEAPDYLKLGVNNSGSLSRLSGPAVSLSVTNPSTSCCTVLSFNVLLLQRHCTGKWTL